MTLTLTFDLEHYFGIVRQRYCDPTSLHETLTRRAANALRAKTDAGGRSVLPSKLKYL